MRRYSHCCCCSCLGLAVVLALVIIDVLRHLPHLQDVVFRHTCNDPVVIAVPGKVADLAGVAAMDEQ
jgi:hypothetical protein